MRIELPMAFFELLLLRVFSPFDKRKEIFMKYNIGVDVGGTSIKMGLFTADGKLHHKTEVSSVKEDSAKILPEDIASAVSTWVAQLNLKMQQIQGVGMGVPGPVQQDGYVENCPNLPWRDIYPARLVEEILKVPVKLGNDANVAALGEQWMGAGKGHENLMMFTLGTGVGGGLILDGKIIAGAKGLGGEVGHLRVNPAETNACGCGGYGCVEQYASATGFVREMKKAIQNTYKAGDYRIPAWMMSEFTCKDIFDAAKNGESLAIQVIHDCLHQLAQAMSYVTYVVDPACFVVGGGVSNAGQYLIDILQQHYNGLVVLSSRKAQIYLAQLGNDAGIYGAARLSMY